MGDAFLTRRGVKGQKITFNNTPMVLTKTLSNVLSVGRYDMAVASDDEYIAFVCGRNSSGNTVKNIDFFNRGGKHWTANWPEAVAEMAAVITNHRLLGFGGVKSGTTYSKWATVWYLNNALLNSGTPASMADMSYYSRAISAIPFSGGVLVALGMVPTGGSVDTVHFYSLRDNTQKVAVKTGDGRCNMGFLKCNYKSALLAGGYKAPSGVPAVLNKVQLIVQGSDGSFSYSTMPNLAVAQYRPTQATIYDQGIKYCLFGLGLALPVTQGNIVQPALVVPNIDVYRVDLTSARDVETTKFTTFTLPLDSNPISAVALGFGDCVLYVVGYMNELTKGYLVQLNPLRITTMEFNFRSSEFQGGVIGNHVGFIAGGIKNGAFSTDVEMIQLLRNVPIYPGMKYKIGSMTSEETSNILTLHPLNDEVKLSGYMKL